MLNDGAYVLHGGTDGFDRRLFTARIDGDALTLSLVSPDGDQGLPGRLRLLVTYRWTEENALEILYRARSDADTLFNPTNHAYWNLGGPRSESVLGQFLRIDADAISLYDDVLRTGRIVDVAGTPYDFRVPRRIGERLGDDDPLLRAWGGYDFNYVLRGRGFRACAEVFDPRSGRVMSVATDRPGLQFYAGCSLDATVDGRRVPRYGALCLEAQGYPFAPNVAAFPSVLLKKGAVYTQRTVYRFTVR